MAKAKKKLPRPTAGGNARRQRPSPDAGADASAPPRHLWLAREQLDEMSGGLAALRSLSESEDLQPREQLALAWIVDGIESLRAEAARNVAAADVRPERPA